MNLPCPNRVACPGSDLPITNYSAEGSEAGISYRSVAYRADGCIVQAISFVSQEDADLQALAQTAYCFPGDQQMDDPTTEPGTTVDPDDVYCNTEQVITNTTDEGTFSYVVPAGTFCDDSQTDADDDAVRWGGDQVISNRFFLSAITDFVCYLDDYLFQITTSDGSTFAAWSITSGDLPAGMFMSDTGLIFGNPGEFGTFVFTVRATKSTGHYAERAYSLTVGGVTTLVLADGTTAVAYTDQLASTGITGGAWSVVAGALPDGLTMDAAGLISGTPTVAGTFTFTVQVTGT